MTARVDAFASVRSPQVRALLFGRVATALGAQIVTVAVGWHLYEQTSSAWSLGLVGLFELAPGLLFLAVTGNVADRYPRRNVAIVSQTVLALASFGLAAVAWWDGPVALIYALLVLVGAARSFSAPAISAFLPQLIPAAQLTNANTWVSSAFQFASMAGPAVGGLIIALTGSAAWAFFTAGLAQLTFVTAFWRLPVIAPDGRGEHSFREVFAGFAFIRRTPIFLAAITLDMFAVLLGGAVALLPMFAKDILHVGADGLGWLRAAPAIGSLLTALTIAHLRPWAKPGQVLIWVVVGFGLATIGFGLSQNFWLSFVCLFLTGLFDGVSVVIRLTLMQVLTPDSLRGRVSAINYVFVGFSNEFGAFESGATAALFGPVASVVGGGIGTIAAVIAVALTWPTLLRIAPLDTLRPGDAFATDDVDARHRV